MNKINKLSKWLLLVALFAFVGCSMPETERKDALKIIEIREGLLNEGKANTLAVLLTDDFNDRKNYIDQIKYQQFYFTEYLYSINSVDFLSCNPFTKNAEVLINFDLYFKIPDDPAATVWLGREEKVGMRKENIGWKISAVSEVKESGKKMIPQLVHDIYYPLDSRKTAITSGDVSLFETLIHPDFTSRSELIDDFRKNSEVFSEINYALKDRRVLSVSSDEKNAEVLQKYDLFFKTKEGDISEKLENQQEIISLKKDADGLWKIVSGLR